MARRRSIRVACPAPTARSSAHAPSTCSGANAAGAGFESGARGRPLVDGALQDSGGGESGAPDQDVARGRRPARSLAAVEEGSQLDLVEAADQGQAPDSVAPEAPQQATRPVCVLGDRLAVHEELAFHQEQRDLRGPRRGPPVGEGGQDLGQRPLHLGMVRSVGDSKLEGRAELGHQALGALETRGGAHGAPPGAGPIAALSRRISGSLERNPFPIHSWYDSSG